MLKFRSSFSPSTTTTPPPPPPPTAMEQISRNLRESIIRATDERRKKQRKERRKKETNWNPKTSNHVCAFVSSYAYLNAVGMGRNLLPGGEGYSGGVSPTAWVKWVFNPFNVGSITPSPTFEKARRSWQNLAYALQSNALSWDRIILRAFLNYVDKLRDKRESHSQSKLPWLKLRLGQKNKKPKIWKFRSFFWILVRLTKSTLNP